MLDCIPAPALPQRDLSSAEVCPPGHLSPSAPRASLAAPDHYIDHLDDRLLELFERRLAVASRVGQAKAALGEATLRLHPRREQAVLDRLLARSRAEDHEAVVGLWREIMGWGRARQDPLSVQVWAPVEPVRIFDGARLCFGAAADISTAADPEAALAWAAAGKGVAVLALNGDSAWWTGLRQRWSALCVLGGFGGAIPSALGVGRVNAAALPGGRRVVVNVGGDAGDGWGPRRQGLATHHGWSLSLMDADLPLHGPEGCVGAVD